jgi:predicted tellurium resistance membrane protein TerC
LFLALLAIGSSDLLFAFDSIPAVFGVTEHPYIVLVANALGAGLLEGVQAGWGMTPRA